MAAGKGTTVVSGTDKSVEISQFEKHLDQATDEVFSTMIGVNCAPTGECAGGEAETISAVIGLAGTLSGSLVLHSTSVAAMRIAERMTGIESGEVDALVRDAVGEMCNMVAGAWKGRDPVLISGCLLSTPTVVSGTSYQLFSQRAPIRIERSYQFEELTFMIILSCELPG
jgi:chemotaxis protein CheX